MELPIPPWPGDLVDLGDRQVFVRVAPPTTPDAEPALYVHGLGGASTNWTDLMELLRDRFDGHAVDLPGFGESPVARDDDYSIDAHAHVVISYLTRWGRGPVHLFGNSLGGAVATRVAADRPDLVRTLTLISPALPDLKPRPAPARMPLALLPGFGPWVLRRLQSLPAEDRVQATIDVCFYDPSRIHPQRLAEAVDDLRRRDDLPYATPALVGSLKGIVVEYFRPPTRRSLWRQAARVAAPTLLVYGRHDRLVDARMAARAARVFPTARVVVLPDTGHVAHMESPRAVAREVRVLLSDIVEWSARTPPRPVHRGMLRWADSIPSS